MSRIDTRPPTAATSLPYTLPAASLQADARVASITVGGMALQGQPSQIGTVAATNRSTGKVLQGALMFGRSRSGSPLFWLQGNGVNYVLRSPAGKPVGNLEEARDRARQLIAGGGASHLRTIEPTPSATPVRVQLPNASTITIDLEDPSRRDGVVPKRWLSGEAGSFFTAPSAIVAATERGVPVQVADLNAGRGAKNLHAYIHLSNDARGGAMYALITAGSDPPFKVPPGASTAFKQGHSAMQTRIDRQQAIATVSDAAAAVVALPRKTRTALSPSATRAVTNTVSAAAPRNKPASSAAPVSSRRPIDNVSMAIKVRNFANTAQAMANPTRYDVYLDLIDGQRVSTIVRVGNTVTMLDESTLAKRTASYRNAGIHNLSAPRGGYYDSQLSGGAGQRSHEAHTAFGAVSKLGEVHANSGAFSTLDEPWSSRGRLPGQGGKAASQFWLPDFTKEWGQAESALTRLETARAQTLRSSDFTNNIVEPLRDKGFIPKGSALAMRIERLEAKIERRDALQTALNKAGPADVPELQRQLTAEIRSLEQGLGNAATQAMQARAELLTESLGTPKITYEMTVRHATAARYMQSVEGQPNAVFSASKFKRILAQVKAEAGPEAEFGLRWHRALVKTYSADPAFQEAMQQSEPMRTAWTAYKARYGL